MFKFFKKETFFKKERKIKIDEDIKILIDLDKRKISYVTKRTPDGEIVLGKDGYMNITDKEFVIMCDNKIVFREMADSIHPGELMSHDGVVLEVFKENKKEVYVAYYKYHRK